MIGCEPEPLRMPVRIFREGTGSPRSGTRATSKPSGSLARRGMRGDPESRRDKCCPRLPLGGLMGPFGLEAGGCAGRADEAVVRRAGAVEDPGFLGGLTQRDRRPARQAVTGGHEQIEPV
jgi:hypothetical protein